MAGGFDGGGRGGRAREWSVARQGPASMIYSYHDLIPCSVTSLSCQSFPQGSRLVIPDIMKVNLLATLTVSWVLAANAFLPGKKNNSTAIGMVGGKVRTPPPSLFSKKTCSHRVMA